MNYNNKYKRLIQITRAMEDRRNGRCFHTSFIIQNGKIISIGVNKYNKTHPAMMRYGYHGLCGIHSELDAALKLGMTDCKGLTLVNIRVDGQGKVNMSAPCKFCSTLIRELGFKAVIYTNKNGDFEKYED